MRLRDEGGVLERKGLIEVVSCLREDGSAPYDIRNGVWVLIEADTDYIRHCFEEYKVVTDPSGRYMCLYKRWHLIGLELGISIASIGLRREPTGVPRCFNAEAVATAKRDLRVGEVLDDEGGYTVFGKLTPAKRSLAQGLLPLGSRTLAQGHARLSLAMSRLSRFSIDRERKDTRTMAQFFGRWAKRRGGKAG